MAKRTHKDTNKLTRSTLAENERRVNLVYEMLLSGLSRYEITTNLEKMGVNVCHRQITRYISDANKLINEDYAENRETARNKFLSQYNLLLKKSILSKDYKTAASIIEKQSKMLGVAEASDYNINDKELTINHTIVTRTQTDNAEMDFTDNGD